MSDGSRHSIAISPETVYGVTNSNPVFAPLRGGKTTLGLTRDSFVSEENRSDRQISDQRGGAKKIGGDIPFELSYTSFDTVLEAVLCGTWGAAAKTATTISAEAADNSYNDSANGFLLAGFQVGDIVTVTGFTGNVANNIAAATVTAVTAAKLTIGGTDGDVIADDAAGESVTITTGTKSQILKAGVTRRSFTIERYFSDLTSGQYPYHRYLGSEFSKMNLKISANAMITGSFGIVGREPELDTAIISGETYSAATTTSPVDSFTGVLKEGGAVMAVATEITLDLDNKIEPLFVIGSDMTILPSIGRSDAKGSATFHFTDSAMMLKFINNTASSFEISMPDAAGNVLKLKMPLVKYSGSQADVSGEGPTMLVMPWQAILDPDTNTNIMFTRIPVA